MISSAVVFLRRHSHTHWALFDQALVSGTNFITGILVAHGLGVADFGRFSLAWLVVLFVQSFQECGVIAPMMSIGPKYETPRQPAYYGGVFGQQLILAVVSSVLTWGCLRFAAGMVLKGSDASLALPLTIAVLLCQSQEFLRRYFFTILKPAISFASDVLRYGGQLCGLAWLFFVAHSSASVGATLWTIAGAAGAGSLIVLVVPPTLKWSLSGLQDTALVNWRSSKWLVASATATWMSGNLLVVAAGGLLGVIAVGALKAAQSLMGVAHILFAGLENVAPIRAAQRFRFGGPNDLIAYLARVRVLGLAGTALIGLTFAVNPSFWLGRLFGPEFAEYGYLVRWYAVLYILMFLTVPLRFGLRAVERTAPIFAAYGASALFSLIVAYPLVRTFGLPGVLVGMLITQLILIVIMRAGLRVELAKAHEEQALQSA